MSESEHTGMLYLDGAWVEGVGDPFASVEPTNGDEVWAGPAAGSTDVDQAMDAAFDALEAWADCSVEARDVPVQKFAAALARQQNELATTVCRETGMPPWQARAEVSALLARVDHAAQAHRARTGTTAITDGERQHLIWHRPHGVVAVLSPFSSPVALPGSRILAALLAGNCVLFKPSEQMPLIAEHLVRLWHEAAIPKGVLQLLQGDRDTGELIAARADLDALHFAGTARNGEVLAKQFTTTPGRLLSLAMGGNNPIIVGAPLSDPDAVLHLVLDAAFRHSGQHCQSARRLFVPRNAQGDALVASLVDAIPKLGIAPWDAGAEPFMGPLISVKAADNLLAAQTRLMALGARALLECRRLKLGRAFLSPGLLDCSELNRVPDEELYGPLLKLIRYEKFEDALDMANDTRFGLGASLLSEDDVQWKRFRLRIRAGIVNRNRSTLEVSESAPLGGIGASGNHRPGGLYAADSCAYPVATTETGRCTLPSDPPPGVSI
ncbi:MAG: succinylglutamate-semialdehyde dehydrogenase [Panacagrimonas sp.]